MALFFTGCGFNNPAYQPYESPEKEKEASTEETASETKSEEGPLLCPDSAVAVFGEMIAPAIATTCGNCHNASHKLPLGSGQNAENRDKLLKVSGLDASGFFAFISGPTHSGGDQSAALSSAKIGFWIDAEKACASE
jgi:hypothetical protein